MTDDNESLGTIERGDGYYEARLQRFTEHARDEVWAMLTEAEKFVEWLAPGHIELRKGGRAKLDFADSGTLIDSKVSEFEAPELLEYSWSGPGEPLRPVRWEIEAVEGGTRLRLTLRSPEDEDIARTCAGWEAHLMMLMAAIEGLPIKFPFDHFMATREAYKQMIPD
jgi:uncharacterized protein YndB with AHSA1/START domain